MSFNMEWLENMLELQKKSQEISHGTQWPKEFTDMIFKIMKTSGLGDIKGPEPYNQAFLDFWFKDGSADETLYKPLISINETDKEIYVKAALPGIKSSSDISIKIRGNILIIYGNEPTSFKRTIYLPVPCDEKNAAAVYKNGTLSMRFSKADESNFHTVEVKFY